MKSCCGLSVPPDKIKNATVAYRTYNGAIRRFLLLILVALVPCLGHSSDTTVNYGQFMDCDSPRDINAHELLGAWYFSLGSESVWKLELKADWTFNVSVFGDGRHVETESMGGAWSLNEDVLALKWSDGAERIDRVLAVTDCSFSITSLDGERNGFYYRKPVPARPCHKRTE